jgi:hypothetical protein
MSPRTINRWNGARFRRVPQKDHTIADFESYRHDNSLVRRISDPARDRSWCQSLTSAVAAFGKQDF